jgi:hypothetical protein
MAVKTKQGLKHGLDHSTGKVYKLKSRKTMVRSVCQPSQTITKDFNLSKIESGDCHKGKGRNKHERKPSHKSERLGLPIHPAKSSAPLIVHPIARPIAQLSGIFYGAGKQGTFQPTLPEKAQHFEANQRVVHHSTDVLWTRWQKEYLQTLQKRCKWHTPSNQHCHRRRGPAYGQEVPLVRLAQSHCHGN